MKVLKKVLKKWLNTVAYLTIKERSKDWFERLGNVFRDIQRRDNPGKTDEQIYTDIYIKR